MTGYFGTSMTIKTLSVLFDLTGPMKTLHILIRQITIDSVKKISCANM